MARAFTQTITVEIDADNARAALNELGECATMLAGKIAEIRSAIADLRSELAELSLKVK